MYINVLHCVYWCVLMLIYRYISSHSEDITSFRTIVPHGSAVLPQGFEVSWRSRHRGRQRSKPAPEQAAPRISWEINLRDTIRLHFWICTWYKLIYNDYVWLWYDVLVWFEDWNVWQTPNWWPLTQMNTKEFTEWIPSKEVHPVLECRSLPVFDRSHSRCKLWHRVASPRHLKGVPGVTLQPICRYLQIGSPPRGWLWSTHIELLIWN